MTTSSRFASKPVASSSAAPKAKRTPASKAAHTASGNSDAHTVYAERMAQINDEYLAANHVPSSARLMVAAITRLLSFSASIYWGIQGIGLLVTAAVVYTGSAFIAFCIGLTTALLAFRAAWSVGTAVGEFVINFNPDTPAQIGRDLRVSAARKVNLVKGWFTRKDDDVVTA